MGYFLQGLMMGFAYVAPIGLQNMFLINAALANGLRRLNVVCGVIIMFYGCKLLYNFVTML